MPFLTPLHSLVASTVALAVAASVGVVAATLPATSVDVAVPAVQVAEAQGLDRQVPLTSRDAEREALQTELLAAVEERNATLASTFGAIEATEATVQQQLAEKAAADKAAAEKEAAAKGGTPSANRELGRQLAESLYGWGSSQFSCYDKIIMRESRWDERADNPTSSAYGIPQALPGKRMASEGADWRTSPATQIKWGLKYVQQRYGTPCNAWSFKRAHGWY